MRKFYKRVLTTLVAGTLAVASLAGCKKDNSDSDNETKAQNEADTKDAGVESRTTFFVTLLQHSLLYDERVKNKTHQKER